MRVARESRGFSARSVRHWPVVARSAGALFIRSYERGEQVHLAMLSRGYTSLTPGTPTTGATTATTGATTAARPARPQEPRMSTPVLDVRGLAYAYPGSQSAVRGGPARPPRRAGRPARPQRRRQDHARAAPQRHPRRGRRRCRSRAAGDQAERAGGTAPGRDRLPGPRRPAVHAERARRRRLRPRQPRSPRGGARAPRARGLDKVGMVDFADRPPLRLLRAAPPGRGGHRARDGAGDPGPRRAVREPGPRLPPRSSPRSCAAST